VLPEQPLDWLAVRKACDGEGSSDTRKVLVAPTTRKHDDAIAAAGLHLIEVDAPDAAIAERISLALIQAVADDRLKSGNRVIVAYSGFEAEILDSIAIVRLGEHLERLTARDLRELETSVPFETLKAVVDVGVEIGREGREGNPVGTLIVVGDVREVRSRSRTLGFDPFRGYTRKERNLRDPRVREAIKEIAQLDGGFVVSRDGTVEAGCQYIDAPTTGLTLTKGLGTRHWAAAAITKVTDALAVVVSQSTGTVRLFQGGEIILRIAPMRHARAMKWVEEDIEPSRERDED
jgi:DNA integrity scanning protein DisA with diadenylate cyclase activity